MMARDIQGGFTLIEVLIALVILSIGLLGVIALQTTNLRSAQETQFRTMASIGAQSFRERVALYGEAREADRAELEDRLGGVMPNARVLARAIDPGANGVERFEIDVRWQARDDDETSLRYIATVAP